MKKNLLIKIAAAALTASTVLTPMNVWAVPITMPDGQTFDGAYYAAMNPDVVRAIGADVSVLYQHYLKYGKAEGRKPYEGAPSTGATTTSASTSGYQDNFDPAYYANNNPDVVAAVGKDPTALYQHYLAYGKAEGRLPCAPKLTEQEVTAKLLALKSKYPDGMTWNDNSYYDRVSTYKNTGKKHTSRIYACAGFAWKITDEVFGSDAPTVTVYPRTPADLKPGDMVEWMDHEYVIISVDDQYIYTCDGNVGGTVLWGRDSRARNADMTDTVVTRRVIMED